MGTLPPGTRLRLKASFDISKFSAANQVILTALNQYGMIPRMAAEFTLSVRSTKTGAVRGH
jgi:hypothetical protein